MSKPLRDFYPLVITECPGVPIILANEHIRNAAIQFCEESRIWIEMQTPYAVVAATPDVTFATVTDGRVHEIRSATWNGYPIDPLTREWCDIWRPQWRPGITPVVQGAVEGVTQLNDTTCRLVLAPAANGTLILEVALKPTQTAATLPDILFNEYKEVIAAGANARLQAMNDVPWRNLEQAAIHAGFFKDAYERANLRQAKGFGRASLRVQAQFI